MAYVHSVCLSVKEFTGCLHIGKRRATPPIGKIG